MHPHKNLAPLVPILILALTACSEDAGMTTDGSGGAVGSGGASGGSVGSGGAPMSGGAAAGGALTSGGSPSAGGGPITGGAGGSESGGADGGGGTGGEIETLDDGSAVLLSQAGLYEADMVTLAPGVRPFEPHYALWTDAATKRRWIYLPEGEVIDTSDMDYWSFPSGTKLFKEFTRDGTRVETRVLTKTPRGGWQRAAYQWREDQMEADALVDMVENANGTPHDIPSQEDCGACHFQTKDKVLGFSAIQLDWDNPDENAWTLARLVEAGLLSDPPGDLQLPGDETAQEALGYMHANCGHCHNPASTVATTRVTLAMWLEVDKLSTVEETTLYANTVCQEIELEEGSVPDLNLIVDPGSPETSALYQRFDSRGQTYSMPPLGTEDIHAAGRDIIGAWISSLDGVVCETP